MKVLIVDDEKLIRNIIKEYCHNEGYLTEEADKLLGFDLGIDDYMTKPFSPKELIARIKAISKRYKKEEIEEFNYLGIKIDFKGRVLYIDNKEVSITPKEFDLLKYFVENPNTAITREQILNKVWGYDYFGDDRTIDTHIKILRNKLGKYRDIIVTVRSIGYKFIYEK